MFYVFISGSVNPKVRTKGKRKKKKRMAKKKKKEELLFAGAV